MASATEQSKTEAIQDSLIELLDPSSPGNRVERSIRETLYTSLSISERAEILGMMIRQGYDRAESAQKMNDLEETLFGTQGTHA